MSSDESGRRSDQESGDDRRSQAREYALSALYEARTKGIEPRDVLDGFVVPPDPLVRVLVEGVADHERDIDELIARYATGWSLERMPTLDLLILRLATFELCNRPDVPVAVAIDEAVELAKRFSTDDSGRFINGVLASVARDVRPTTPN
ncbi:MAG: transcription antitermination protein NusB [Actinomycetota bacterium]